jgi:hypothetical protein
LVRERSRVQSSLAAPLILRSISITYLEVDADLQPRFVGSLNLTDQRSGPASSNQALQPPRQSGSAQVQFRWRGGLGRYRLRCFHCCRAARCSPLARDDAPGAPIHASAGDRRARWVRVFLTGHGEAIVSGVGLGSLTGAGSHGGGLLNLQRGGSRRFRLASTQTSS